MAENVTQPRQRHTFEIDDKVVNIIIFVIIAVGLIIFTILMSVKWSKTDKYMAQFSDEIVSVISINANNVTLDVTVQDQTITQKGKMVYIDKDADGNKVYEVTFDKSDDTVMFQIRDDGLVLMFLKDQVDKNGNVVTDEKGNTIQEIDNEVFYDKEK